VVVDGRSTHVPVIVTVAIPSVAVELAVRVIVLLPLEGFVPNDAVTPLGSPETARLTLAANPAAPVTATVLKPDAPWVTIRPDGELETENAVTLRVSVAVEEGTPLEVPVTVIVAVPRVALELAVNVTVPLLPGFALHAADTPLGSPDTVRPTLPVNPPTLNTATVLSPEPPWAMFKLLGDAERMKLGGSETTRSNVVLAAGNPGELPPMVTVVVPRAAVGLAVNVSTLVPVVGLAPNDAVTPTGRFERARVTLPLNPPTSVTVMVVVAEVFWTRATATGAAAREKPDTARGKNVVELREPEVPVMPTL
jgi:hypothetical protein